MGLPASLRGWFGVLVGLLAGAALLAAGCDGGEQQAGAQAVGEPSQAVEVERQSDAEPEPQQESAVEAQQQGGATAEDGGEAGSAETAQQGAEQQQVGAAAEDGGEAGSAEAAQQDGQQTAAPQAAEPQQAGTAAGERVSEGTRLITLFGDITEIVYALGAEEHLVARDASSIYPAEAETLPNLGFAGTLNAEAVLALEPTLVIGTQLSGPAGVLDQLRDAGVEVLLLDAARGIDAPRLKIEAIGAALGIPGTAAALADEVERRLAAATAGAEAVERPLRVLHVYIRRGGVQLVSGAGNEAQTIIEAAGGIDAAAETGIVGWESLTPEALVAIDPEVYLVMDRGLEAIGGLEGLLAIPGMAETRAGRSRYVVSMPDLELLLGPRLPEAVADLSAALRAIEAEIGSE